MFFTPRLYINTFTPTRNTTDGEGWNLVCLAECVCVCVSAGGVNLADCKGVNLELLGKREDEAAAAAALKR